MDQAYTEFKENSIRKSEALHSIYQIAREQQQLLVSDDAEGFLELMDKRRDLMDRIDKLDEAREPLRQLFLVKAKDGPSVAQMEIDRTENGFRDILRQIQELDGIMKEEAGKKLEEYRKKVREARTAKKRVHSYAEPYNTGGAIFIDAKK